MHLSTEQRLNYIKAQSICKTANKATLSEYQRIISTCPFSLTCLLVGLTNEFKNLLKVLSKVLLAVICRWQPFVAQPRVDVVEGQVCGHVDHIANVEAQQKVQVLGVFLIPQIQKGKDGADHGILGIWSHHTLIRQRSRQ